MITSVVVKKLTTPIEYILELFNQPKDGIDVYSIFVNQTDKHINLKLNYDLNYQKFNVEASVFADLIKRITQHYPEAVDQVATEDSRWKESNFTLSLTEYWCPYFEEIMDRRIEIELLRED